MIFVTKAQELFSLLRIVINPLETKMSALTDSVANLQAALGPAVTAMNSAATAIQALVVKVGNGEVVDPATVTAIGDVSSQLTSAAQNLTTVLATVPQ